MVEEHLWNIYYHLRLEAESLAFLETHVDKLLQASKSLGEWHSGPYGSFVRFCNERTLVKIKTMWTSYSTQKQSSTSKEARMSRLTDAIDRARNLRKSIIGETPACHTWVRSVAPASLEAISKAPVLCELGNHWFKTGIVGGSKVPPHLNPTFLSSPTQALTLHYGTDPLLGFPLATAFIPMLSKSPYSTDRDVIQSARLHFRSWIEAFTQAVKHGCVLRFCVADALAFCLSLQAPEDSPCSTVFCDNWTFEPLWLDSPDYQTGPGRAPTTFDVIETSNLMDHLGPLNLLVAAAPLLSPRPSSVLNTELLVRLQTSSVADRIDQLLGGDFKLVALLLGLAPIEAWTNVATSVDADEAMFEKLSEHLQNQSSTREETSSRTRLCWRKLAALYSGQASTRSNVLQPRRVEIEPQALAEILYAIHKAMFLHEDSMELVKNIGARGMTKMSNPCYNRASFAALVKSIRSQVKTDWGVFHKAFGQAIDQGVSPFSGSGNFDQELLEYLHFFDIKTVEALKAAPPKSTITTPLNRCFGSKGIPVAACVTLQVPRSVLSSITSMKFGTAGTPTLCCSVQSLPYAPQHFMHLFTAVQMAFGQLKIGATQPGADAQLDFHEDPTGWEGTSPLYVSFFAPTWILASSTAVACGLVPTVHAMMTFQDKLGVNLKIYGTELQDASHVFVSRFMPNMHSYPSIGESDLLLTNDSEVSELDTTFSMDISNTSSKMTAVNCRIALNSDPWRALLADRTCAVSAAFLSPLKCSLKISGALPFTLLFPTAVNGSKHRLRIARKSSYIEVLVPILEATAAADSSCFIFPMSLARNPSDENRILPLNWNLPFVNLDRMPQIDVKRPKAINWLVAHVSASFSTRERTRREADMENRLPTDFPPDLRLEIKEGVFAFLMMFTGLQGKKAKVLSLVRAGTGVHVMFFPSALRLDLASRTVILDAAVLPLTSTVRRDPRMQQFLHGASLQRMCQTKVTLEELRVWKAMLPAMAERVRTWKHSGTCEYAAKGEVPLTQGLEDARTSLCSCGIGKFPAGYLKDSQLPQMEHALREYATRIAVSPIFAVPYVEPCFLRDVPLDAGTAAALENLRVGSRPRCNKCGRHDKKDGSSGALLGCARCKKARYCSADCQKANWKSHKIICKAMSNLSFDP